MKILYILNIAKRVDNFLYSSMVAAQECGLEFHVAGNWSYITAEERIKDEKKYGIKIHQIDFVRTPYNVKNFKAYKQLIKLCEHEEFDIIHCNTPIGGVLGRLVGKKCKVKKVIYQAHGFHFYKGAPLKNWLVYYPIEKWLSHKTDALITINKEDYELAKTKMHLRNNGQVYYIPGVGIDLTQYDATYKQSETKREELGFTSNDIILISVGELNVNKNNKIIIAAMEKLKDKRVHYILCGEGDRLQFLERQVQKAQLCDNVHFLGYRTDVKELLKVADCFVMPSLREGLSRSMMEAMASGLPCVASKIRGNTDLLNGSECGFLCQNNDVNDYAEKLKLIVNNKELRNRMGQNNQIAIRKFSLKVVLEEMRNIYEKELLRKE